MRHINELNIVGDGADRRVETKDVSESCQEIVVNYPRTASDLSSEGKARFASLATKGLAHLGFDTAELRSFTQKLWENAGSVGSTSFDDDSDNTLEVVINGVTYVPA